MFVTLLVLALAAAVLWGLSSSRAGFRDRTYSVPIGSVCVFFSLDVSIALDLYDRWFPAVPMWALGIAFVIPDVIFVYQIIVYGPRHFPRIPAKTFRGLFVLAMVIGAGIAPVISRSLHDTHGAYTSTLVVFIVSVCYPIMLYHRGTLEGQSVVTAGLWLIIAGTGPTAFLFAPSELHLTDRLLLGYFAAASVVFAAFHLGLVVRMRGGERGRARAAHSQGAESARGPGGSSGPAGH
ncbi:hypothetical protein [Saccharothrix australiensis]|uniref:hypothetical protein n=1 Tax=Saccharothrix australiensis TaxID=2072 RepID=UPI0011C47CBE|nr:hypothetical protein [Saccharothrix australiensis]